MEEKAHTESKNASLLQRLRALPEEEQQYLRDLKRRGSKSPMLIGLIAERYEIHQVTADILRSFWRWHAQRQEIREANACVENIRQVFMEVMPGRSDDETHKFLVEYLTSQGFARKDPKELRFATVEMRKRVEASHRERRIKLLEDRALQTREALDDETLPPAERMERIKEIFGIK